MTSANPADDQDTITALLDPVGLLDGAVAAAPSDPVSGASAVTSTAAVPAQDHRSDTAKIEASWARLHSTGMADVLPDGTVQLWNFGVGSTTLRPGHKQALKALLAPHALALQLCPGALTAQLQGSASDTGSERANGDLAVGRAQAVADWLSSHGVTVRPQDISADILPIPGHSGEGFANVRAVFVHLTGQSQSPPTPPSPPPAPVTIVIAESAKSTPEGAEPSSGVATLDFPVPAEIELKLDVVVMEVPPNEWVEGKLHFVGAVKIKTRSDEDLIRLKASGDIGGGGEITGEFTKEVTDWLTAKVEAGAKREDGQWAPKAAVSAVMNDQGLEWEVGLQVSELPIFAKSPKRTVEVPSEDLHLGLSPGFVVELEGGFELELAPGPAALEAAGDVLVFAPEIAAALLLAGTLGAVAWLANTLGNSRALGDARAAVLAARYGFAAEAAQETTGAGSDDVAAFLAPYQKGQPCSAFAASVASGRASAASQLAALGDGRAARLSTLKTSYGADPNGTPRGYAQVADAMLNALDGAAVGSDPPQLSQL